MGFATQRHRVRTIVLLCIVASASGTAACAQGKPAAMAVAKGPRIVAAEEIHWLEDPRLPGVRSSVLWGDPNSAGEHALLRRFPAGYAPPRHSHPSTESVVMIAGHIIVEHEGGKQRVLGRGSYSEIPGNVVHAVRCTTDADCIFVLRSPGSFAIRFDVGEPEKN